MNNNNLNLKDAIYEQFARIGKAISSPKRIELLELLAQGERTVELLAGEAGLSVANTSQHLQVLKSAHLVEAEKVGLFVTYCLADQEVCGFLCSLRALAKKQLAEVEMISKQFLGEREELEQVDRESLLRRIEQGTVIVLDVRPREEYLAGHIPGAISVPLAEMERHLDELPQDREIVAYCRGPYCMLASQAVKLLRARGYRAVSRADSVPEWRLRGLPIDKG